MNQEDILNVQRCLCANVRRVDRAITQIFDEALAPIHLYFSQISNMSGSRGGNTIVWA